MLPQNSDAVVAPIQAATRPTTPTGPPPHDHTGLPPFMCPPPGPLYHEDDQGHRPHERCAYHLENQCGQNCILDRGNSWCGVWQVQVADNVQVPGYEAPFWDDPPDITCALTNGYELHAYY